MNIILLYRGEVCINYRRWMDYNGSGSYYLWGVEEQRIYIFIFLRSIMEAYELTVDIIVQWLAAPSHKALSQSVIQFLHPDDLKMISQELQKKQMQNSFTQLIRTHYFLTNFLNKVDRTFYYSFYEDSQLLQIQAAHSTLLAHNYSNCFLQFPIQYRKCLQFIARLFPDHVQPAELTAQLQRIITDTDIPMPKLKRQNQGIYCRTSFQNYLIYLRFKSQCFADYDQVFEGLNIYLQEKDEIYLQKLFMKATKDKTLSKIIRFVRFTPYQITYSNHQQYLVPNNSLHNFLVSIFALTDVWLTSIKCYIASLDDPFHRYIELITRYSIYRNYVISVQQNLSFVFQQYNDLYCEVFGAGKPMYRFWRPAMTKWMLKFEQYHAECSSVYYYCLTKLRTRSALQFLECKQQQQPDIYMSVKNRMNQREHEIDVNETLIPSKRSNGVEDFFENDQDLYLTILIEYMEYMIDLSINEETVHWCGHSEQILNQPYLSFEKYVLAENKMYLKYIRSIMSDSPARIIAQQAFYQHQLQFLQSVEFKPIILKKLVEHFNYQISDTPSLSETFSGIEYNFRTADETLRYFNQKASIKYSLSQQQMYFYSITPLVTADELLTKSISTNCTEVQQQQSESECEMEYFSHSSEVEDYENQGRKDFDFSEKKKYLNLVMQISEEVYEENEEMEEVTFQRHLSNGSTNLDKKLSKQVKKSSSTLSKSISQTSQPKKQPKSSEQQKSKVGEVGEEKGQQVGDQIQINNQTSSLDCP